MASFSTFRSLPTSANPALARLKMQHARSRSNASGGSQRRGPVPVYAHSWSGGGKQIPLVGAAPPSRKNPMHRATSSNSSASSSSARGKGSLASEVLFEEDEEDEDETPATSVTGVTGGVVARGRDTESMDGMSEPSSPSMIIDHYLSSAVGERRGGAPGGYSTRVARKGSVRKLKKERRLSKGKGKMVAVNM
jgi:hypothetical protein